MVPPVQAAAILTGGLARRFQGHDKSSLVIDGRTILETQLALLAPLAGDLLVVTSAARAGAFPATRLTHGARLVLDAHPGTGPLGATLTALDATGGAGEARGAVFVLGGDMPHVPDTLVRALAEEHARGGWDVTAAQGPLGLEPLCAVFAHGARPHLARALEAGRLSMRQVIRETRLGVVDAARYGDPARIFRNLNAPWDVDPRA